MEAGVWKHYKGGYYQVLGVGEETETGVRYVVYVSLDAKQAGPRMRLRPVEGKHGWEDPVPTTLGRWIPRFVYVGDEITKP
jgi:hypothetical protein